MGSKHGSGMWYYTVQVVLVVFFYQLLICQAADVTCNPSITAKLDDPQFIISCDVTNIQSTVPSLQVGWSLKVVSENIVQIATTNPKYEQTRNIIGPITKVKLTVMQVVGTDGGKYTLTVQDGGNKNEVVINVVIEGPPRITNQHNNIFGPAGEDLILKCDIRSWPIPTQYKWYHKNVILLNDINRYSINDKTPSSPNEAISYLRILKFNTSNEGEYICDVYNNIASATFKITARVGNDASLTCQQQYQCNNLQTCDKSHGCTCIAGYSTNSNGGCADIDECYVKTHNCQSPLVCSNTEASYECTCQEGYVLDVESSRCELYVPPVKPPVNNLTIFAIVGVVMAFIIIAAIVVIVFIVRRKRQQKKTKTPLAQYGYETSNTPTSSIVHQVSYNQVEIQNEIGKGRFGKVYIAKAWNIASPGAMETVAVKQSRQDITEDDRNLFLHEISLVKNIPYNRHIVRCVGYFYEPMISMLLEYMPFGDLLSYLRQKRPHNIRSSQSSLSSTSSITSSHIFNFALQCAKGMQHLHENKIIHRDLAARNILIASENCCKISDFGMARKVGEDYTYTSKSKRPLPLLWMSPEAIYDDLTSNKSDVWSYGVLLWEMITLGSRPYPGRTGQQVLELIQGAERMERPPHCAMEIYGIMTNCWQHQADDRPEFHELVDEVEMRLDFAENYLDLTKYNQKSFYFIDHVSMSDLDLDHSEVSHGTFRRTKSRKSHRSGAAIHL